MKLTVVVDNLCSKAGLLSEWGYSSWLETKTESVLIDTGSYCHVLLHNLNFLKLDPKNLSALVLSHSHFDHISGLLDVLRLAPQVTVYAGKGFDIERRGEADGKRVNGGFPIAALPNSKIIDGVEEILEDVFAFNVPQSQRNTKFVCCKNLWEVAPDGSIRPDSFADDVSLTVKGEKGWSLLLGCSHSGLPNIIRYATKKFGIKELDTVIGGSHLCAVEPSDYPSWVEELKIVPVRHWRLSHCTSFKAAAHVAKVFEDVDWAGAGSVHLL